MLERLLSRYAVTSPVVLQNKAADLGTVSRHHIPKTRVSAIGGRLDRLDLLFDPLPRRRPRVAPLRLQ